MIYVIKTYALDRARCFKTWVVSFAKIRARSFQLARRWKFWSVDKVRVKFSFLLPFFSVYFDLRGTSVIKCRNDVAITSLTTAFRDLIERFSYLASNRCLLFAWGNSRFYWVIPNIHLGLSRGCKRTSNRQFRSIIHSGSSLVCIQPRPPGIFSRQRGFVRHPPGPVPGSSHDSVS